MLTAIAFLLLSTSGHLSKNYENQLAREKQDELYSWIKSEEGTSVSYPNKLQMFKFLFFDDVNPTLDHVSDVLPYNHNKRLHPRGGVSTISFESDGNHQYTGLFKGAPFGLARLSQGKEPKNSTVPGLAVKFFRDGMRSGNFVAMFTLAGQASGNYFENKFSNHVPDPTDPKLLKLARKLEGAASPPAGAVGLSDIASYEIDGTPVKNINFPYELIFEPNPALSAAFDGAEPTADLRVMLKTIEPHTKLYDMYARSHPNDENPQLIGALRTTSPIIYSTVGDNKLFFKHQRFTEDIKLRQEWKPFLPKALPKAKCPFPLESLAKKFKKAIGLSH